jgi:hypothetical protein
MKLQELAVANPTKQAAQVFESYFGKGVNFDAISSAQARAMLKRVRSTIAEHRRTPAFHTSERNPAYLKLVVMEQALTARVMEEPVGMSTVNTAAGTGAVVDPMKTAGLQAAQQAQKKRTAQDQGRELDKQIAALTKQKADLLRQANMPTYAEGKKSLQRRLQEASEVQQAQVVLASQDMVDQVQKMSEQISAMQFKDLPALVDQIKNEVGVDQAMQFNTDATAALAGLLQNLGGAKQQLESALGVVTGQAPQVPGIDASLDVGVDADIENELPAPDEEEIETDIEVDDEKDSDTLASSLGRSRR